MLIEFLESSSLGSWKESQQWPSNEIRRTVEEP